jgi:hypothetical protein
MGKAVEGMRPLKAIRQMCMGCVVSAQAVRDCDPDFLSGERCPLHEYRLGKRPRELTEAERQQRRNASPFLGEKQILEQERGAG